MAYAIQLNKRTGAQSVTFNASSYKTYYTEYRNGQYGKLIEMMKRAEIDSHVSGCLKGRRAGFQQAFSIIAFDDSEQAAERADLIRSWIKNLDHRRLFRDIFDARMKKFSVIDFDWEIVEGKLVPVDHKKHDHQHFRYDPKEPDVLRLDQGKQLAEIPDDVLLCETQEMPEMLPVLRDYILKDFGLESWAAFIETFGEGIIIGKYPPGADDKFKDAVETAVNAIARSSRGTMPEGGEIEIKEANRTTGDHSSFKDTCDRGISIQILGHANAVEQSKGLQVGENLTQFKVKREIAVDDMFFIEHYMQQLINTIERLNWNDNKPSTFELDKKEPVNIKERLEVLDLAHNHGVAVHIDEYRKLDIDVQGDDYITKQNPFAI